MLTCIDTCCLINLMNGGLVEVISRRSGRVLQYQGLVDDEIQSHQEILRHLTQKGFIKNISGSGIYASEVGRIIDMYNIGLGEAECIAISLKSGCAMASDDGKARLAAQVELGKERVIGSLGMLTEVVGLNAVDPVTALSAYRIMKDKGGFLPRISQDYFGKIRA